MRGGERIGVLGISEVSIGYGSPQLPALLRHLAARWPGTRARLVEPDQSERPPRHGEFADLGVLRLLTRHSHYTPDGQIEYLLQAAEHVDRVRPQVLVLSSALTLPLLLMIRHRPAFIIYYLLESLDYYLQGGDWFGRQAIPLNRMLADRLSLVIACERQRAERDLVRGGLAQVPLALVYNCVNGDGLVSHDPVEVVTGRDVFRVLYAGTIQRRLTFAEWFLEPAVQRFPIDLYGLVEGADKAEMLDRLLALRGMVRYLGYLDAVSLARLRPRYAFTSVAWSPDGEHTRFASPNKFFESIADGIPVIAAPHPQCVEIVQRYGCGIVMADWSAEAFAAALAEAERVFADREAYLRMVGGCIRAVACEVNWRAQMAKLDPFLPASI